MPLGKNRCVCVCIHIFIYLYLNYREWSMGIFGVGMLKIFAFQPCISLEMDLFKRAMSFHVEFCENELLHHLHLQDKRNFVKTDRMIPFSLLSKLKPHNFSVIKNTAISLVIMLCRFWIFFYFLFFIFLPPYHY